MSRFPKRVSRILAVGGVPPDRVRRLTRGESFTCVAGSEKEHADLRAFCLEVTEGLAQVDLILEQLSPEELKEFLFRHGTGATRE